MFGYSIHSLFKCFVCTTALYLHADKNKIPCLYSAGSWGDRHEYNFILMCAASERQRGWAIRRGNWGLRRQFLEQQDAWTCSTSRNHEWKDLCVCELEKMLEVSGNVEEYFRPRKQHIQFSSLFTIFKTWFFL